RTWTNCCESMALPDRVDSAAKCSEPKSLAARLAWRCTHRLRGEIKKLASIRTGIRAEPLRGVGGPPGVGEAKPTGARPARERSTSRRYQSSLGSGVVSEGQLPNRLRELVV